MKKSKDETKRTFQEEGHARDAAFLFLKKEFEIFEEVNLLGRNGERFRVDAICLCRNTGYIFGIEFKKSHLFKSEFADTLRQAIYYSDSTINDERLGTHNLKPLNVVGVFPDWLGEHDDDITSYDREANGMRILACHFKVGALRLVKRYSGELRLDFVMGEQSLWNSEYGWSKNSEPIFFGRRKLASRKK